MKDTGPDWSCHSGWPWCPSPNPVSAPHTVQQRRQEHPVARGEPHLLFAQPALEHRDLMPQGKDLHLFVAVAHRQQP
jgi:hypothetical protein